MEFSLSAYFLIDVILHALPAMAIATKIVKLAQQMPI
jgi:hypothetical protein